MSAGHTPGPWAYSFESVDPEWAVITTAGGSVIANVNADHRQAANAALIASAPDLLQELRNIANADTAEWDDKSEFEVWAKSRARAAIANATASQPIPIVTSLLPPALTPERTRELSLRSPSNWPDYAAMGINHASDVEITINEYTVARQCILALDGLNQDALNGGWNFKDHGTAARNTEIERDRLKTLNAELAAALEAAQQAINSMKTEAETAAMGDEQMMTYAMEVISNEGLEADMAIRAALAGGNSISYGSKA